MSLIPVAEAEARLLDSATPIARVETISLTAADGRVLAEDLHAILSQPPFDNSAMDGYALRHADIATPGAVLTVIGQSAAGHRFEGVVSQGEAVRIFTGAPLPDGADTVLIQEDAERLEDGRIRTTFAPAAGRHIRPRGQDFTEGQLLVSKGSVMDFGRLTLAAAANVPTIPVFARPLVAILATGDELVPPGETPGPDQIIASSLYGIAALARACGADVLDLGIAGDDRSSIAEAVERAKSAGADVLVTLGGASVGDHDLVQASLVASGMVLDFWRIAMRPGKPLMVGRLDGMHVLGLPGNPVSSLVCGLLFLEPLLLKLGSRPGAQRHARAVLASPLGANDRRQDYVRASLERATDGTLIARPFERQDSSMMDVFARSDCLIVRSPGALPAAEGEECNILLLRQPG